MAVSSPTEFLTDQLRDIYSAEKQLSKALPKLNKRISHEAVKSAIQQRIEEGGRLIEELEEIFSEMDEKPGRKKCEAMEGLIEEANTHAEEIEDENILDAAMIGAAQKVEHYCIAAWGTAKATAQALEQERAVEAMERALEEGKRYDEELNQIAESEVNPSMLMADDEDMEDEEEKTKAPSRGRQSQGRAAPQQKAQAGRGGRQPAGRQAAGRSTGRGNGKSGGRAQAQRAKGSNVKARAAGGKRRGPNKKKG